MDDPEKRLSSDLQSESWSTTTVNDPVYEKDYTENEAANVVQAVIVGENADAVEEEVYEEYEGDYQENRLDTRLIQTYPNQSLKSF